MALVRQCEKCGTVDNRQSWASADEAARQGAFEQWACPMCAWTEFELVDADEARSSSSASSRPS
jgi:predicted nucleic-acid-binding Zn-ribbon protein